jgi:hypothetical protein
MRSPATGRPVRHRIADAMPGDEILVCDCTANVSMSSYPFSFCRSFCPNIVRVDHTTALHITSCGFSTVLWCASAQSSRQLLVSNNGTGAMQAVNEDGKLTWTQVTVLRSFRPHVPNHPFLRMTTAAGQVRLGSMCKAQACFVPDLCQPQLRAMYYARLHKGFPLQRTEQLPSVCQCDVRIAGDSAPCHSAALAPQQGRAFPTCRLTCCHLYGFRC